MARRSADPAVKPHARKKAERGKATLSFVEPNRDWAADIRRTLLDGCHPYQLDAVVDPARRYSYCVGRGGAKTTSFRVRGTLLTTGRAHAKVLYFASTRARAKDLMWSPLKALLHKLGITDATWNETELRLTIHRTGSTYQLSGLQDIADADKWRGETYDEVQFDECGAIKPSLLEYTVYQVIGPRVRCLGLGGTPGRDRRGLFYDVTRPGSERHRPYRERENFPDHRGYSSHTWTLEDVVKLPDAESLYPALVELWGEAQIEKADNKWTDDNPIWLREYRAIWATDGTMRVFGAFRPYLDDGRMWNIWDPFDGRGIIEGVAGLRVALARLKKDHPDLTDWRFAVPMDSGHKDPFACSVFAFSPHDPQRRKWQCMSFERTGMGYGKPIAELLLGADQVDRFIKLGAFPSTYGGVFGETGWPDGIVIDTDNALLEDLKNVYGIKADKADKKPEYKAGAIELANGEFTDGRFFVLLGSPMAEQLEQLQWRELDSGKLVEDPAQANHCLVAGTMIRAERGLVPIEDVRRGERVWTRNGLMPVSWSGCTGVRETWRAAFECGTEIVGTAGHPVWSNLGWVNIASLTPSCMVSKWVSTDRALPSCSAARNIVDIQRPTTPACAGTSQRPTVNSCIERSGPRSVAQFLTSTTFTTKTGTTPTTALATSSLSTDRSTLARTDARPGELPCPPTGCLGSRFRRLPSGTDLPRGEHGTARPLNEHGLSCTDGDARSAVSSFSPRHRTGASVGASVIQERVAQAGLMMSGALASSAVKRSPVTGTTIPSVAPVRVVSAARTGHAEPVFDLTVDGAHEFFANDILVHNSSDLVVYGLREIAALFESGQVAQDEKPRSSADKMHAPTFVEPTISTLAPSDGESDLPPLPEWAEDDDW